MDQKEPVSGNRDPLLEFSDTMAQWYRCLQTARAEQKHGMKSPGAKYLPDSSPYWIVHVMTCSATVPGAGRLKRAGIHPSELRKYDGKSILMVTDASGLPLGFDVLDQGWSSCLSSADLAGGEDSGTTRTFYKIVTLLKMCMDAPMGGGMPRQPKKLRVNDNVLHRLLHHHVCKQGNRILGVKLRPQVLRNWKPLDQGGPQAFSLRWPPVRYCNTCKRRSFSSRLRECSQCKAVFHCEDKCFPADAEHECAKLASYMAHEAQLAELPFSYAAEVTSEDFSLEDFLFQNKLVGSYWVQWSLLLRPPQPHILIRDAYSNWLSGHSDAYKPLKQEADVLMSGPDPHNIPRLKKPLVSWLQYYEWRGLSLSSVVAPLLSSSLSIYYIITSLVPAHFPEVNILKKRSLRIHIIESYREFHTLLSFWELSVLLPYVTFELVFIGRNLPKWCDQKLLRIQKLDGSVILTDSGLMPHNKVDKRSIRVKVYRSAYHSLQESEPDLVIGFKPAFLLNNSWFDTLPKLQSLRVPAFFCEISELRCESSQPTMNEATGGTVSPPAINPFHCPLRINGGDNRLPRYSNGFVFHLIYKPSAGVQHPVARVRPDRHLGPPESPHRAFRQQKAAVQRRRRQKAKMKTKKM